MRNLKKQVEELEKLFDLTHGQLNTEVRAAMKQKIDLLKEQADKADATNRRRIVSEAIRLMASLLSIVTNVMTLLE